MTTYTNGQNLFKIGDHYYGTDNSEIKEGDCVIYTFMRPYDIHKVKKALEGDVWLFDTGASFSSEACAKIIFTTDEKLGLPVCVLDEAEILARGIYESFEKRERIAFIRGYRANPKKYTEAEVGEILKKFCEAHPLHRGLQMTDYEINNFLSSPTPIIQSLEIEMEEEVIVCIGGFYDCHCQKGGGDDNDQRCEIKYTIKVDSNNRFTPAKINWK